MLVLAGALLLALLIVGPATLTGHPLLIAVGAVLGVAILIVTRRRSDQRESATPTPRR